MKYNSDSYSNWEAKGPLRRPLCALHLSGLVVYLLPPYSDERPELETIFVTVPAVPKDACTLLSLQAKKPKNLLLKHVWRAWGLGGRGKFIRVDVCEV